MLLGDNMERLILHIDVNSAFLSWTASDLMSKGEKDIREECSVISPSRNSRSGIVLAKSIKAKEKGIITGEPLYMAQRKCRYLKVYSPDYGLYQRMSNALFQYIGNYTPDIEQFSIDECYLDYTNVQRLYGDVYEFAMKLKEEVKNRFGFTINIGIGNNKLCAKMASDFSKPNKIHTLYTHEIEEKMWPLEIDQLFGVGRKTGAVLKGLGIHTIYDLAHANYQQLYKYFKNRTQDLINSANGIDDSRVISEDTMSKGMGNSTTLEEDLESIEQVHKVLEAISNNLGLALREEKRYAFVVSVQLKDRFFKSYSKQRKLKNATSLTSEIYQTAKQLVEEMWDGEPIRLVGIRLDQLVDSSHYQMSLFEDVKKVEDSAKLEDTLLQIKKKYGSHIIDKASLMDNKIGKKY